ncbi:hypothetical protein PGT21_032297 [Puccinia graminis f. sp. tritici]|uniref:Uncharacterized protein n=1 Tax=Puccinia graminis f. sp. tritici TaxID=56615 RepID=A0A5B0RXV2_PUCGR|nr:hypothetical protein PGT21_032297 [Puccinia graminis f. sp. tritici]KAA1130208.1 hypothetical protein PGTUg99_006446 [Puccinia graminis f. sp. tritici]
MTTAKYLARSIRARNTSDTDYRSFDLTLALQAGLGPDFLTLALPTGLGPSTTTQRQTPPQSSTNQLRIPSSLSLRTASEALNPPLRPHNSTYPIRS